MYAASACVSITSRITHRTAKQSPNAERPEKGELDVGLLRTDDTSYSSLDADTSSGTTWTIREPDTISLSSASCLTDEMVRAWLRLRFLILDDMVRAFGG